MTGLFLRIEFESSGRALGPGMMQLLELIVAQGSIRSAAISMKMSYRKAWALIKDMETTFDGPVVTSAKGGSSGGGTQLTELGSELLKTYRRIQERVYQATEADVQMLAKLVTTSAKPSRSGRRRGVRKQV
jgi:molybdate transport system regulatory protein